MTPIITHSTSRSSTVIPNIGHRVLSFPILQFSDQLKADKTFPVRLVVRQTWNVPRRWKNTRWRQQNWTTTLYLRERPSPGPFRGMESVGQPASDQDNASLPLRNTKLRTPEVSADSGQSEGWRRRSMAASSAALLLTASQLLLEASQHFPLLWAAAADERAPGKYYTNLDEAREAGERRRDERDRAQGPVITLPSGVKYRELEPGTGKEVQLGEVLSVCYTVYRFSGLYVDSVGYGKEGKNDVGDVFVFKYGSTKIPKDVELGLEGMRVGGKRRILVRPDLGWVSPEVQPEPTSGAASRRFANAGRQPLLFELELLKAKSSS